MSQGPAESLVPEEGWHFLHLFYRVDRARLAELPTARKDQGIEELKRILGDRPAGGPEQLQCLAIPAPKADSGAARPGPQGGPWDPDGDPGVEPRAGAGADVLVLLDHRGLGIRPGCRGIRTNPPRARGPRSGGQHLSDQGQVLYRAARRDEPPAALP